MIRVLALYSNREPSFFTYADVTKQLLLRPGIVSIAEISSCFGSLYKASDHGFVCESASRDTKWNLPHTNISQKG